jgi:hypothetical protein
MAGCLENVQLPPCVWFEGDDKRNAVASIVAGVLVSITIITICTCQCISLQPFVITHIEHNVWENHAH